MCTLSPDQQVPAGFLTPFH